MHRLQSSASLRDKDISFSLSVWMNEWGLLYVMNTNTEDRSGHTFEEALWACSADAEGAMHEQT